MPLKAAYVRKRHRAGAEEALSLTSMGGEALLLRADKDAEMM
jgi:hypothetical protein